MENKPIKGIIKIRPIYLNEDYLVDEEGIIYSKHDRKPLSQFGDRYKRVHLVDKDGNVKGPLVHRCVAMTFLRDTYKEGMYVNHKDGNKFNNNVENLEWVTPLENSQHADKVLHKIYRGKDNISSKSIVGIDKDTNEIKYEFDAIAEGGRYFGGDDYLACQRINNSLSAAKKSKRPWRDCIWYEKSEWEKINGK